jgi:hypothetical protein
MMLMSAFGHTAISISRTVGSLPSSEAVHPSVGAVRQSTVSSPYKRYHYTDTDVIVSLYVVRHK